MMNAIRRNYIYVVAFISLQVIGWAAITLLRNLFDPTPDRTALAWQLALLIIGTPLFVGHWLWAQRLAAADEEELEAVQRRFYLFAVLASLLGPFLAQIVFMLNELLQYWRLAERWPAATIRDSVSAMVVLAILGGWHYWLWQGDERRVRETAVLAVIRRLFQWGFTVAGLVMVLTAVDGLLTRLFLQLFGESEGVRPLIVEISRLIVGLPVLVIFWRWNQRLFSANVTNEQRSLLRKIYLYVALFISMVTAVTNIAILFASILQTAWGIEVPGELSDVLALIVTFALSWGVHLWLLKRDEKAAPQVEQQVTIRQMYQYLSAGVGLLAFLVGVGGLISVLIRALAGEAYDRTEIAWYIAAAVAGLPLWVWFWRQIQQTAVQADTREHDSLVRRSYLYIFVLLATLTILSAGVYIVYRIVALAMGLSVGGTAAVDLGHALAYGLLALGIWLYHGQLIRADSRRQEAERASHLSDVTVLVLDAAEGQVGQLVTAALRRALPGIQLQPVGDGAEPDGVIEKVGEADIIIGPWTMAKAGLAGMRQELAQAIMGSPAHKLLLPTPEQGWSWAGVDEWVPEEVAQETAAIVEQLALGSEATGRRRWGFGSIFGAILGGLILLVIIFMLMIAVVDQFF